jgi:hypothetical protein
MLEDGVETKYNTPRKAAVVMSIRERCDTEGKGSGMVDKEDSKATMRIWCVAKATSVGTKKKRKTECADTFVAFYRISSTNTSVGTKRL